jgi:hypothetical protein
MKPTPLKLLPLTLLMKLKDGPRFATPLGPDLPTEEFAATVNLLLTSLLTVLTMSATDATIWDILLSIAKPKPQKETPARHVVVKPTSIDNALKIPVMNVQVVDILL